MAATTASAPVAQPSGRENFQIALICALKVEFDAVEALFDEYWDDSHYGKAEGDPNAYTTGRIGNHNVVLAFMPGMGKSHSSSLAASFRTSFTGIKLGLVVGICGGVPYQTEDEELVLGDVVLSTGLVQFDLGHQLSNGLLRKDTLADNLGRPSTEIRSLLAKLSGRRSKIQLEKNIATNLSQLQQKEGFERSGYPGKENDKLYKPVYRHKHHNVKECKLCEKCVESTDSPCDDALDSSCSQLGCQDDQVLPRERLQAVSAGSGPKPIVHFGIIGSGDQVMKSAQHRDSIAKKEKIIAFEMEGAGVWDAFPTILIKSVADYADSHKNKIWQRYAAATAASCMKAFLVEWKATGVLESPHKAQQQLQAMHMTNLMSRLISGQPQEPGQAQKILFDAIQTGDLNAVKEQIAAGQNLSVQTTLGTPLGVAILTKNQEIVRTLLEGGANIEMKHKLRYTPLQVALQVKSLNIIMLLLRRGAKLATSTEARTLLYEAVKTGNKDLLIEILKFKPNINLIIGGEYLLNVATANSDLDAVKALLNAGANPSNRNSKGNTALLTAMLATKDNHAIAEELTKHCAATDIQIVNTEGYSPLKAAMRNQPPESVDVLLKAGAVISPSPETNMDFAIRTGRPEIVTSLLAYGVEANSSAKVVLSRPLHTAAEIGNTEIGELLLSHGADLHTVAVNYGEHACLNALAIAVLHGQINFINWLVGKGIDVNAMCDFKNAQKPRPAIFLLLRTKERVDATLQCLLENGADIDFRTAFLDTVLCAAAQAANIDLMKALIENNASLDSKVSELPEVPHSQLREIVPPGRTPLHLAATIGNIETIELLLARGANVDAQDLWGCTAIHCIACSNQTDGSKLLAIQKLLSHGAKLDIKTSKKFLTQNEGSNMYTSITPGSTPTHTAVSNFFALETTRFLLQNSQTIDSQDEEGKTPLHVAVERPTPIPRLVRAGLVPSSQLDVIQILTANKANVQLQNSRGETAFFIAAKTANLAVMTALLDAGSDIDHSVGDVNAVVLSAKSKDKRIIDLLLKKGAKITPATARAAFPDACKHGNAEVVKLLLEHGLLEGESTKFFPLHIAAIMQGNGSTIELLLKHGVDVNRVTDSGRTALHEAAAHEMTSGNIQALMDGGADKTLKDNAGHTAKDIFEKRCRR